MLNIDIKKLLALITLTGFFLIILILFFIQIPVGNMDLLKIFGMALISIVSGTAGYYFGSSEGSARKTELMATDETPPPPPPGNAGFAALRLLLPLLIISSLLVIAVGCATTAPATSGATVTAATPLQNTGKALLAVKSTIVVAATSAATLCKAGTLKPTDCDKAAAAYEQAKPAYDAAVDAYLLMTQGYGDQAAVDAALGRVQAIALNMLALSGGAK